MSQTSQTTLSRSIAVLRVGLGAWMVWLALPNLDRSFIEHVPSLVETFSAGNPYGVYHWLLNQVVLPNAETVGALFPVAQVLVGASLIIGFMAQWTALAALLYAANFVLMSGHLGVTHQSFGIVLSLACLVLVLADAGRVYGLDGFFFKDSDGEKPSKKSGKKKDKGPKFKNKKQKEVVDALNKKLKTSKKKKPKKQAPAPAARAWTREDEDDEEE